MMRHYMLDPDGHIVLVRMGEYDFDRYMIWAAGLDKGDFIVIDGTLATAHLDNRRSGR